MPTKTTLPKRPFLLLLVFISGHFLLSLVATEIRNGFSSDSVFWGLAGLSSAVLAQTPIGWRRALVAGVVASGAASYLIVGASVPVAAGFAVANGAQVVIAAHLLRVHLPQGRRIVRIRDIGWLVTAAIVSASAGAAVGGLTRWLDSGSLDVAAVGTWFMANAVGMLVGAPVVLALFSLKWERPPEQKWVATLAVAGITAVVFAAAMWSSAATARNFSYLVIVPVMISAVWLGQRHTALLVGALAVAVAVGTSRGLGPFAVSESAFDPLLAAQLFMSVVQLTALTVGVESSRRRDVIAELDGILAATVEGVLVVDETGTIRHTNAGTEAILAGSRGQIIGQQLSAFVPFGDFGDDAGLHLTQAVRLDGSTFWAEVSRGDIHERSGRRRTAVVVRDVTRRIETEEQVQRIQDEFVSNMTHELKTPLTAIIGFSEWLVAEPDSPDLVGDLETIQESALSMKELIDDILDFKRVAGSEGATEAVSLRAVVGSAIDVVSSAANDRSVEISLSLEANPTVTGDADQLEHAVQNILSNAVKYSIAGGRVDVVVSELGQSVVLSVTDQGIGIPEPDQERLFERFFRAGNTGEIHGTGLGLALVRQVVERHGGEVDLTSVLGQGTCVSVTLPLAEVGPPDSSRRALEPLLGGVHAEPVI